MRRFLLIVGPMASAAVMMFTFQTFSLAQMPPGEPIKLPGNLAVVVTNPADIPRERETVSIPIADIRTKAPDFNPSFFRVKNPPDMFEPLDIPSQIVRYPGEPEREYLVFQIDLPPRGKKTVAIQYNPNGSNPPAYPAKTRSFEKWYTGGVNIAWESERVAYRSYSGLVDYFAKSYPHLRLHDLPADSYHHEATWGVDPFVIGKKPGLCGVALVEGTKFTAFYGSRDSLRYTHRGFGGGPVCAGAVVGVLDSGVPVLEECYTIFADRHENIVRTTAFRKGVLIAPGMQKNDGEIVHLAEKEGYIASQAPAGEYGAIGMALAFDPATCTGVVERPDGRFIKLRPGPDGSVVYASIGVWYRVSDRQPSSMEALRRAAEQMALRIRNPLKVEIMK